MIINRPWAFWRRLQYLSGVLVFFGLILTGVYFSYFYEPANCNDGRQNGEETGVDCGGGCARVCAFTLSEPQVDWARSFQINQNQYNAVGYVSNSNLNVGTPSIPYTFTLYDDQGLIAEKTGSTKLAPDTVTPVFAGPIRTNGRTPTQTFLELGSTTEWYESSVEAAELEIIRRNFYGADTKPRLRATVRNTTLRDLEDIEVVATIFDQSRNALTASKTFVREIGSRSEQEIVFTWPRPIANTVRSCEIPTDVVMAIDLSGSMNDDGGTPPEPISSVLNAASKFAGRLQTGDQASVVTFATDANIPLNLTSNLSQVQNTIGGLGISSKAETGFTNTGEAIKQARSELESSRHNPEARKVLVLLTDGLATAPEDEPERYALTEALKLKSSGAEIYTIGLGEQVNMNFLRGLAGNLNNSYQALNAGDVNRIYTEITSSICEDGPAIIEIVPKVEGGFIK